MDIVNPYHLFFAFTEKPFRMLKALLSPLVNLFYPRCCEACGENNLHASGVLCLQCLHQLPQTRFHLTADNPVEKVFYGRLPIKHASAAYYYNRSAVLQQLIHLFKYKGRQDVALHLGRLMGQQLQESTWLYEIDALIPVPLNHRRLRQRGYNQALLLACGVSTVTGREVLQEALRRQRFTDTQTRKGRAARWQNVAEVFTADAAVLSGKHVLLIDDVITTGATTEACGHALIQAGCRVSVGALAFAWH